MWNRRLVAAELHGKRLNEIYRRLIREYTGDGLATLRTYAMAISALIEELSADELAECQEIADIWNRETPPKEIQQKCVTLVYDHLENDS